MENDTIDLMKIFRILKRRFLLVFLVCVLSLATAFVYSFFIAQKVYSADVLLYIWQDQKSSVDAGNSSDYTDMLLFTQLVNDYQVLIKSRLVVSQVATAMNLNPEHSANLADQITVGTKNNTRHLTITVRDPDPNQAALIANKVSEIFAQVVVKNMGAGTVNIIDQAVVPTSPSSPNKSLNIALGLVIGLVLGVLLAILIEMIDNRIRVASDIEAITGYRSLGFVPVFDKKQNTKEGWL